jgi:hypothetical protein
MDSWLIFQHQADGCDPVGPGGGSPVARRGPFKPVGAQALRGEYERWAQAAAQGVNTWTGTKSQQGSLSLPVPHTDTGGLA